MDMPAIEPPSSASTTIAKPQPPVDAALFAALVTAAGQEIAPIDPALSATPDSVPESNLPRGLAIAAEHGAAPVARGTTGQVPAPSKQNSPDNKVNAHAFARRVPAGPVDPPAPGMPPVGADELATGPAEEVAELENAPTAGDPSSPLAGPIAPPSVPAPAAINPATTPSPRTTPSSPNARPEESDVIDLDPHEASSRPSIRATAAEHSSKEVGQSPSSIAPRSQAVDADSDAPTPATAAPPSTPVLAEPSFAKHLPGLPSRTAEPAPFVTHTPSPRFAEDVGIAIARHGKGLGEAGEVTLRIEPPSLGRIEVKLQFDERGQVQALVSADQPRVLEQLRLAGADLHRGLVEASQRTDIAPPRFEGQTANGSDFAGAGGQSGQHQTGQGSHHPDRHASQRWQQHSTADAQPFEALATTAGRIDLVA